jgi:hypothetical protein
MNMQATQNKLKVDFTSNGDTAPPQNGIEALDKYYKEHPVKRGGCGQRLPGKFKGEGTNSLYNGRWVDVVEPMSTDRQMVAVPVGPSPPACKRMVQFGNDDNYDTNSF